jgi:hypothetical protein
MIKLNIHLILHEERISEPEPILEVNISGENISFIKSENLRPRHLRLMAAIEAVIHSYIKENKSTK